MSGKGSTPRPFSVDRKTFEDNWDRIFGNSKVRKEVQELRSLKDPRTDGERQREAWMKEEYYDVWDEK